MNNIKERLLDALKCAVSYFNQGKDPTNAVIKAAQDHNLNVDQAERLAEMFNNARTIYHYKHAADRAASFELCNKSLVAAGLFVDDSKKAAQSSPVLYVDEYSQYDFPEPDPEYAFVNPFNVEKSADAGYSFDTLCHLAMNAIKTQKDMIGSALNEAGICSAYANKQLDKLAALLNRGFYDECVDRLARFYAVYANDNRNAGVFAYLDKKIHPDIVKSAKEKIKTLPKVVDLSDLQDEVALLKSAEKWLLEESSLLSYAGQLEKEARDFEHSFYSLIGLQKSDDVPLSEFLNFSKCANRPNPINNISTDLSNKDKNVDQENTFSSQQSFGVIYSPNTNLNKDVYKKEVKNLADFIVGGIGGGVGDIVSDYISESVGYLKNKSLKNAKNISERLRNVHREVILEDLLLTDPVLSKEDPNLVSQAYLTIVNIAPDLSLNKEVVRAILRSSVHQLAIGPYDAGSWAQIEKVLRQLSGKYKMTEGKDDIAFK